MEEHLRKILTNPAYLAIGLSLGLAACSAPEEATDEAAADPVASETGLAAAPRQAVAMLMTADGTEVGTATASAEGDSVSIRIEGADMPPGEHGVHVHTTGLCEGPAFTSAGGHWNPAGATHGLEDPAGQHAGDMPNLEIAEDGTGSLTYTLAGGATFEGLMDADGSAFLIHAMPDDQVTDPSGDSGDRIACGVFEVSGGDGVAEPGEAATM